jgi:hypothetical protein
MPVVEPFDADHRGHPVVFEDLWQAAYVVSQFGT